MDCFVVALLAMTGFDFSVCLCVFSVLLCVFFCFTANHRGGTALHNVFLSANDIVFILRVTSYEF